MDKDRIGPLAALSDGWAVFVRYPLVLSASTLVCIGLILGCAIVPYNINWLLIAIYPFPLLGGLQKLYLHAVRGDNPRFGDIFTGFGRLGNCLVTGYGALGVWLVGFLPLFLLGLLIYSIAFYGKASSGDAELAVAYRTMWLVLPAAVGALGLTSGYYFVWPAAIDGEGWRTADIRSHNIARGRRLRLFLTYLTLGCFGPIGLTLVGLPVYITNANAFGWPGWVVYWASIALLAILTALARTTLYVSLQAQLDSLTAVDQEAA